MEFISLVFLICKNTLEYHKIPPIYLFEEIKKLSTRYQMDPVVVAREYCQHNILASFYNQKGSEKFLFKGGML